VFYSISLNCPSFCDPRSHVPGEDPGDALHGFMPFVFVSREADSEIQTVLHDDEPHLRVTALNRHVTNVGGCGRQQLQTTSWLWTPAEVADFRTRVAGVAVGRCSMTAVAQYWRDLYIDAEGAPDEERTVDYDDAYPDQASMCGRLFYWRDGEVQ